MKKLALPALLAALFAAALYWALRGEPRAEVVAPVAAVEAADGAEPVDGGGPVELAPSERTAEIPAAIESAPHASVAEEPPPEGTAPDRLAGTIVVVDEHGVEHAAEDGRFQLVLWGEEVGLHQEVEVVGGGWETEWAEERRPVALGVTGVVLGERAASFDGGHRARLELPANGWLELRVRWVRETILRVRDAADGRELAPVLLVETDSWLEQERGHPGARAAAAVDRGPSPVELAPSGEFGFGLRTFFAGSPGYAWGKVQVDESQGGERVVDLARGGDLEVELAGEPGAAGAVLRVRRGDAQPFAELPLEDERRFEIAGLPAGPCELAVEIGDWWDDPVRLGEVPAEVVIGTRTRALLTLRRIEPARRVPFSGVLVLPEEWEVGACQLVFELLDTPLDGGDGRFHAPAARARPGEGAPDERRWRAPDSQPGRYEVEVAELGFSAVIELPAGGTDRARVEVPPPCTVRVRCVDAETGAGVTVLGVSWRAKPPKGVKGWSNESAEWDPEAERWVFRAPVGEILLSISSTEYAGWFPARPVTPGVNEVELRLDLLCKLTLLLRDGEAAVPWDGDVHPVLEPLEGQAPHPARSWGGGILTLLHKEPGRYRLKVPTIPGYEPIPDEVVVLEKGVTKEHAIELRRER